MKLRETLGSWITIPHWDEWWNEEEERLYVKEENQWRVWIPTSRRSRKQKFQETDSLVNTYSGIPVSCARHHNHLCIVSSTSFPSTHNPPFSNQDMQDDIKNLPSHQKWAIDNFSTKGLITDIIQAITEGIAMAVSDGSVKRKRGTSCFILTDPDESFQVIGLNRVPGKSCDPQRAELSGVMGTVTWLKVFCKSHQINHGSITIGLDGHSAIKALQRDRLCVTDSDYDIIWNIKNIIQSLPVHISLKWIKGHQTDFKDISQMDIWGCLNEVADTLAKTYWQKTQGMPHSSDLRLLPYAIYYNYEWLSTYRLKDIYNELKGDLLGGYWAKRKSPGIPDESQFFNIDWDSYHRSCKPTSFGVKLFLSKGLAGFAATGKYMKRTYNSVNECPRCGEKEDFVHIIKCQDTTATNIWETHIEKAMKLIRRNISPYAAFVTEQYLRSWREDCPPPPQLEIPLSLRSLFHQQTSMGWTAFCVGRVSTSWNLHTTSTDSHNNPKRWVHSLIQKLCSTIWNMWDHRNTVLHDPEGRILSQQHHQLNAQIRLEYMLGSIDLHPDDQPLLRPSIDYMCSRSLERKQRWLASMQKARTVSTFSRYPPSLNPATANNTASTDNNIHTQQTLLTQWLSQGRTSNNFDNL